MNKQNKNDVELTIEEKNRTNNDIKLKKPSNNSLLLSGKRTELSNIRTVLSFFQSSIACLSVAFAFMKLDKQNPIDTFTICLFIASFLFLFFGICIFFRTKKHIKKLESN